MKSNKVTFFNSKRKKEFYQVLNEQFGFESKFEYEIYEGKDEKIYLINRETAEFDISKLNVNTMGLYVGKWKHGFRCSIEGAQLIGPLATKNVFEISDGLLKLWIRGHDTEVESELEGFVLIRNGDDFYGCGKIKDGKLYNYVPKIRRLA